MPRRTDIGKGCPGTQGAPKLLGWGRRSLQPAPRRSSRASPPAPEDLGGSHCCTSAVAVLQLETPDPRSPRGASNLQRRRPGSTQAARPTCARRGLQGQPRRARGSASLGSRRLRTARGRRCRARVSGAQPGGGREAGGESLGRARASQQSGHPGRDNSGGRGRERGSHLPDARRTARPRHCAAARRRPHQPGARSRPPR